MYSYAAHESRNLKQARPFGQDVDLLRKRARYSLTNIDYTIISQDCQGNFGIL